MRHCPALLVSAPASGQGKTTITAALARLHRQQGRCVHVFKAGPDFLDPMILQRASGNPVYQLDLWMGGQTHCQHLLYQAAKTADLILIEGVMGLFDGKPSSADIAAVFGIPVLTVIDATAMAQTFGAIVHGLTTYRSDLQFLGILANQVASKPHADMLRESLPPDVPWLGAFYRHNKRIPNRYLGLTQADEIDELDHQLDQYAKFLSETALNTLPPPVSFAPIDTVSNPSSDLLKNIRIAIASDRAFSFIYPANLSLLETMGATLQYFSPLNEVELPEADSLYLPGGYPELHLEKLAANKAIHLAIKAHHIAGKPIVAECGGMLYLLTTLTDNTGRQADMVDVFHGNATLQKRLVNLGLHSAVLPDGELRGHTFHHSHLETILEPSKHTQPARKGLRSEAIFQIEKLIASYIHWYFPSNPAVTAALFKP